MQGQGHLKDMPVRSQVHSRSSTWEANFDVCKSELKFCENKHSYSRVSRFNFSQNFASYWAEVTQILQINFFLIATLSGTATPCNLLTVLFHMKSGIPTLQQS